VSELKDYMMDWIGSKIKKERPKSGWIPSSSSAENNGLLKCLLSTPIKNNIKLK
jgi:hypothetical protein